MYPYSSIAGHEGMIPSTENLHKPSATIMLINMSDA